MNVVGINGSARKDGNTSIAIKTVFAELEKEGISTRLINIAEKKLHGCRACYKCFDNKDSRCVFIDDDANEMIDAMINADGIILGSPVYFSAMSSETKALIDRAGLVVRANGNLLRRKVGAAVVAVRRAGGCSTFMTINQFFLINEMVVPGSSYWNIGVGREPGAVLQDDEGMNTFKNLGVNMAWLLKNLDR